MKIGIIGISGRMGKKVKELAEKNSNITFIKGISKKNNFSEFINLCREVDVLIDFSLPSAFENTIKAALKQKIPIVSGVTGLNETQKKKLKETSRTIPIFYSSNFSIGMALCHELVSISANALPYSNADIIETHHIHKKDAPSGSALSLSEKLTKNLPAEKVHIHSIRAGKIIGEHIIQLHTNQEKIEIKHQVSNRAAFANGAIEAAKFLIGKDPGLYGMENLLNGKFQ